MAARSGHDVQRVRRVADEALESLPEFPALVPLAVEHLAGLRRFGAHFEGYSDFDATSLWAWSAAVPGGFRVGRWGANLVVEFGDYLGGERFLSLLGVDRVDAAAAELLEEARARDLAADLRLVPEVTADLLDGRRWLRFEQRDEHDYVYDLGRQAAMAGPEYRSQRRRLHRFLREHERSVHVEWATAERLSDLADDLLAVFESWRERGSDGAPFSDPERLALDRLLRHAPVVAPGTSAASAVCWHDGRPVAFTILEEVAPGRLCLHFRKVAHSHLARDLEAWLTTHVARRADAAGFVAVNEQQDLGIPGLRRAKLDRRPARLLRKFRV